MKKKQDYHYLFLIFIILFILMLIMDPANLFASKTDWVNQHSVFPDYFRTLFYDTGNLIPNFAAQVGSGQNIYSFSYYGLFNPIILISYLLPFLSMTNYILLSNIILIISSSLLLYKWLKSHCKDTQIAFSSTLVTILSASFIFQFHRHFMFVSYMPFLIIGLIGIDQYFKNGTRWIYLISTFLMIMTSYYYSIIGIIIFVLYGISRYIKLTNRITIKVFLKDGIRFLIPIVIGIMMAGILLLPTAYAILSGRGDAGMTVTIKDLFLPSLNIEAIVYDNYALGMTSIAVIAILYLLFVTKKPEQRFLNIVFILILLFPICIYLLNGTLYIRNKVFIPFLPLMGYFITKFISHLFDHKIHIKKLLFIVGAFVILLLLGHKQQLLFYLDLMVMILAITGYLRYQKKWIFFIPLFTIVLINLGVSNYQENFISKQQYQDIFSHEKEVLIKETLKEEPKIVRFNNLDDTLYTINKIYHPRYYQNSLYSSTYNNDYDVFYKQIFQNPLPYRNKLILAQNNNILFQTMMGVKYIITDGEPPIGYRKIKHNKAGAVYQNDQVLPLAYATNHLINEKTFDQLSYPDSAISLIGNAVVKHPKTETNYTSKVINISPAFHLQKNDDLTITKKADTYFLKAKQNSTFTLSLEKAFDHQVLFITFELANEQSCNEGDQKITINGVMNKLTCKEWQYHNNNHTFHYVLSQNTPLKELKVTIEKGEYHIKNIQIATLDYEQFIQDINQVDPFTFDMNKTKGDNIVGEIPVSEDGYFITSIPYDVGFTVSVDGKEIAYEKVNKAFLGFPITKGKHSIVITYKAPFLIAGKYVSLLGFGLFFLMIGLDQTKSHS